MTQDVLLKMDEAGAYDLVVDGAGFAVVDGFETAIVTSLFTDDRAPSNQVQTPQRRRGWAGNILNVEQSLGSILWLWDQARLTDENVRKIELASQAALSWISSTGAARSISSQATKIGQRKLRLDITIMTNNGQTLQYAVLWSGTNGANLSQSE